MGPSLRLLRLLVATCLLGAGLVLAWPGLRWAPPPIPVHGGEEFTVPVLLAVPDFRQDDPSWADDTIGGSEETLRLVGCALSSAAMVASYLDVPCTPRVLNQRLKRLDGYTWRGWLRWQAVADSSAGRLRLTYAGGAEHGRLDACLRAGIPAIVRVPLRRLGHWVVVVGKRGRDYLVNDPLGTAPGPVPLASITDRIQAMRVFRAAPGGGW
jgi:hypothetical protein